jgi:hypothetical protein
MSETAKVYTAIAAVMAEIGKEGIAKDRKNQQQGYTFRGIDEIYNALSPILSRHKLCIMPRILARQVTERQTAKGGVLFSVVVEAEFDFICAEDGSKHIVRTFGEAMDSADKATNKAMSAAYKYAAMQAFCIPTEGENDADGETHEIAPAQRGGRAPERAAGNRQQSENTPRTAYLTIASEAIRTAKSDVELRVWWDDEKDNRRKNRLTQDDVDNLRNMIAARIDALAAAYTPPAATSNGGDPFDDEIPF